MRRASPFGSRARWPKPSSNWQRRTTAPSIARWCTPYETTSPGSEASETCSHARDRTHEVNDVHQVQNEQIEAATDTRPEAGPDPNALTLPPSPPPTPVPPHTLLASAPI